VPSRPDSVIVGCGDAPMHSAAILEVALLAHAQLGLESPPDFARVIVRLLRLGR
jgi:hypothetical protein